jgi:hypothetical protein
MVKLASLTGYTPGSASVTFGNIKRKLKLLSEVAASSPATPKKGASKSSTTPQSTGKRGAKMGDEESPTKRAKETPAKKARNDDEDDDEYFIPKIKKEEANHITQGADVFYKQIQKAGRYDFEHDGS